MENIQVSLHATFKWWAKPVLFCTVLAAVLCKREVPDSVVDFVCRHGMRVEIVE